jgi:hypothetical protein
MKVIVEVVMARVSTDEMRYSISKKAHPKSGDPLDTAKAAVTARFPRVSLKKAIVHSTSWRYDDESIVLTFLAYSDEIPLEGLSRSLSLDEAESLASEDEGQASIAAHAIRHLAFLVATEAKQFVPKIRKSALARIRRVAPDISRTRRPQPRRRRAPRKRGALLLVRRISARSGY